jgi:hypothetical protein
MLNDPSADKKTENFIHGLEESLKTQNQVRI